MAPAHPANGTARTFGSRLSWRMFLDAALAVAVFIGTLTLLSQDGGPRTGLSTTPEPIGIVLAACTAVPLLAWRRFPLGVFVVTVAASVPLIGLGPPAGLTPGPTIALYLLASSRQRSAGWTVRWAISIGLVVLSLGTLAVMQGSVPTIAVLAWALAWLAGERTRLRLERTAQLSERAQREWEAERERLLAIAEERVRIARDLHDSAGHAISLIAVRAGAARLRHTADPDRSTQALQAIEELARHTVDEIDHLVRTLRDSQPPDSEVEAPPGLASLDTLIAHHTAAGLAVTLETTGQPRPLGGPADQGAYRIVQEALTNAARHGTGSARVDLAYTETAVELTVTNPVRAGGPESGRGGQGLIRMRERATLLGGSLDIERGNGSFRVRARIPYEWQRQ